MNNTLLITDERIGTVSPLLHSHFAEHLGELFYPGMWAGHGHPLADANGWRADVIAALGPAQVVLLAPSDLRACNRIGEPIAVAPQPARQIEARDGTWHLTLPPGAVVRLQG